MKQKENNRRKKVCGEVSTAEKLIFQNKRGSPKKKERPSKNRGGDYSVKLRDNGPRLQSPLEIPVASD